MILSKSSSAMLKLRPAENDHCTINQVFLCLHAPLHYLSSKSHRTPMLTIILFICIFPYLPPFCFTDTIHLSIHYFLLQFLSNGFLARTKSQKTSLILSYLNISYNFDQIVFWFSEKRSHDERNPFGEKIIPEMCHKPSWCNILLEKFDPSGVIIWMFFIIFKVSGLLIPWLLGMPQ